ncbi:MULTISPECIES: winged helix DNA-binding protein [Hahella]|uniref:Predicted transcription regulator, contains HTH domain (MarR family) n=1 Tax=Hahella chejuensis (strain KCTC 2396) TaxID=349521 RepID=Q2S8E9_HAHCH|nr:MULTISPECIES: winged helix DNA-binding protein [Hahella]ABC33075.1 predicted transcription regulator, contains HTH domain (MarR family) [Hahella chejuensis KCTC 2396]AZZ94845.1 MarR family transcriptional regulator [Hahella sp. KA22]MBU6952721.1 winged helix DNA-binding protein [Hahella sp. HN01]MDG9667030.1 winged helix DNA-binding protein [Hahella sp. CR1]QAY58218.1 MarR family transcriptional regulator [Hahella sp. KA22]
MTKSRIVSSSHLLNERSVELSEFEYALIMAENTFQRWLVHCMSAAGNKELSTIDILVLHNVYHRERPKRIADICFILHIDDTHTVSYSLRKLAKMGLVTSEKVGKETFYSATESGAELCLKYREVRNDCLVDTLLTTGISNEEIGEVARVLRTLTGVYDQAARAAASL